MEKLDSRNYITSDVDEFIRAAKEHRSFNEGSLHFSPGDTCSRRYDCWFRAHDGFYHLDLGLWERRYHEIVGGVKTALGFNVPKSIKETRDSIAVTVTDAEPRAKVITEAVHGDKIYRLIELPSNGQTPTPTKRKRKQSMQAELKDGTNG